jgi:ketosteroid isomerase-like protein
MTTASIGTGNTAKLVRQYFAAYESKDRESLEDLLSDDFIFTSPLDARIGKERYFERCWPYSEKVRRYQIERLFEKGNEALVLYELEPFAGERFRNAEFFRIDGGKIEEVEVYFGSLPSGD